MRGVQLLFGLLLCSQVVEFLLADTLSVGSGHRFATIAEASRIAQPGDVIVLMNTVHSDASTIERLTGRADAYITITGRGPELTRIEGQRGLHFIQPAYVRIENLAMSAQSGNAINIDDGGTVTEPAHHIEVRNIRFERIQATGNIDYLKLSGVDSFLVENIVMTDGAAGGSGIDMVGCHNGLVQRCRFERMGSNAIQVKGGSRFITIRQCMFVDAGQRAINLGGSTGLPYFRPPDATSEASDLLVYSNIFIGGVTAFGYVGCERVRCVNNLIMRPTRWVFRILQENVDPQRFVPCRNNMFRNNVVVFDAQIATHVNIGPNTEPITFTIENNLWYNSGNPSNSRPQLPVTEVAGIYGENPGIIVLGDSISIGNPSAVSERGRVDPDVLLDYYGRPFSEPPSIGAVEVRLGMTSVEYVQTSLSVRECSGDADYYSLSGHSLNPHSWTGIALRRCRATGHMVLVLINMGQLIAVGG